MPTGIKRTPDKPNELSLADLAFIGKASTVKRKHVPAKAIIFQQGAPADAIYYIIEGTVQITVLSKQGREGMIGLIPVGGFAGESSLTSQKLYLDTATAFRDSVVLEVPAARMRAVLKKSPSLSAYFTNFVLQHAMDVQAELVDHLFNSSEKRLARILLMLANYNGSGKLETIPHMTQGMLADRVGTTRARISFFMNKFRRLGLIDYNGEIQVHSGLLNVILNESDLTGDATGHRAD